MTPKRQGLLFGRWETLRKEIVGVTIRAGFWLAIICERSMKRAIAEIFQANLVNGFPSTSDCYLLGLVNLRMLRFRTNCGKTGSDPLLPHCP